MESEDIEIKSTADISSELLEDLYAVVDGWYAEGRIDWDDFFYRLEKRGYSLPDQLSDPVLTRLQREVRKYRAS
ncbi:hypothetical protein ACIBAH_34930 [Streptomyces sp. NPDC051445]|uniref:hypothetical protein n=1 Tax=Streptomyces sp. NPDC051445 TaxID=3365653 RepID=UPI00378C714A